MRLIDADALKAVFEEKSSEAVCGVELCKAIIFRINKEPTVDAVPVIRCRDCKYWLKTKKQCGYTYLLPHFEAGEFCSRAERKEE